VKQLLAADPRPGGLLSAMRARGTLQVGGSPPLKPAPMVTSIGSIGSLGSIAPTPRVGSSPARPAAARQVASTSSAQSKVSAPSSKKGSRPKSEKSEKSVSPPSAKGGKAAAKSKAAKLRSSLGKASKASKAKRAASQVPSPQAAPVALETAGPEASSPFAPSLDSAAAEPPQMLAAATVLQPVQSVMSSKQQKPPKMSVPGEPEFAPPAKQHKAPPKVSIPGELEPWQKFRERPLPEKVAEDNYDISDKEDTDNECEEQDRNRANKAIPAWCVDYKQALAAQEGVDPDSIFSSRVPFCDLDGIFPDTLYARFRQKPPKRKRGSSCQWHKDRLSISEIARYRAKMGQLKRWSSLRKKVIESKPQSEQPLS